MKNNHDIANISLKELVEVKVKSINEYKVNFSNRLILMFVLEGNFSVEVNKEEFNLRKDDLFFINENQLYTTKSDNQENLVLFLKVDPLFFLTGLADLEGAKYNGLINVTTHKDQKLAANIKSLLANIVYQVNNKNIGFEFKVINNLYSIAELLISNLGYFNEVSGKLGEKTNDARLQRIIEYININYKKKITLEDVAKKEDLSYYYLSHFIKSSLGITFQDYLNKVRLNEALRLLMTTRKSITDVYIQSGFPSMAALNNVFRNEFATTPGVYRRKFIRRLLADEQENEKLKLDNPRVTKLLRPYWDNDLYNHPQLSSELKREIFNVDFFDRGVFFVKHWQRFINIDGASNILDLEWQKQFLMLQKEIEFKKIRLKVLLFEIARAAENEDGYNWSRINDIFDFLHANQILPIIHLTSKTGENKNISGPRYDVEYKTKILKDFLKHVIDRYGLEAVDLWTFEVFDEPVDEFLDDSVLMTSSYRYFEATSKAIKSISQGIKVGGPSASNASLLKKEWFTVFSSFVKVNRAPIDFLSLKLSSDYYPIESLEKLQKIAKDENDFSRMLPLLNKNYHKPKYLLETLERVQNHLAEINRDGFEVSVAQWSTSSIAGDLNNDTMGVAPVIIKNMVETIGLVNSIGYINFSDLFERYNKNDTHFYGGVGLINKDGIKKPSYNAYYLLSKLGENVISVGDNYIITKSQNSIQILAFNYAQFDELYSVGERSHINLTDRYSIFKEKANLNLEILIDNLNGNYEVSNFKLNRESGSAFDEWVKIGAPKILSDKEIEYLKTKDHPQLEKEEIIINNNYQFTMDLPLHGVEMLILKEIK